jgi:hypothetical protein
MVWRTTTGFVLSIFAIMSESPTAHAGPYGSAGAVEAKGQDDFTNLSSGQALA